MYGERRVWTYLCKLILAFVLEWGKDIIKVKFIFNPCITENVLCMFL